MASARRRGSTSPTKYYRFAANEDIPLRATPDGKPRATLRYPEDAGETKKHKKPTADQMVLGYETKGDFVRVYVEKTPTSVFGWVPKSALRALPDVAVKGLGKSGIFGVVGADGVTGFGGVGSRPPSRTTKMAGVACSAPVDLIVDVGGKKSVIGAINRNQIIALGPKARGYRKAILRHHNIVPLKGSLLVKNLDLKECSPVEVEVPNPESLHIGKSPAL